MPTTQTGSATNFITFSRGSLATVTDADGKIKWAPHNLLLASEQFDASSWLKANLTVSANAATAPNGTTTADTCTLGAGTAGKYIYQVRSSTAAQCIIGIYVKIATGTVRYIQLLQNNDTQSYANFDITGNAVGTKGTNTPNSSITSVGSDWYYLTATFAGAGESLWVQVVDGTSAGYSASTSATGTFHLWGASLTRADLGGMQANASAYPYYNPSTPKNLLGYSEAFTDNWWVKSNVTTVASSVASPTGGSGGSLVYPSSTGTNRFFWRSSIISGVASTPYTMSVYAKANGINFVYFGTFGGGTTASDCAFFDLQNGTKTQTGSGFTSATITPIGNGWYRCSATAAATAAGVYPLIGVADANNNTTVTASGTNGIYLWGAQLSDSASLDAYVPNFGAAPSAAAAHGPRLDYTSAGVARGLLVEEARTNLLQYSNDLRNTSEAGGTRTWLQEAGANTITVDYAVGLDGATSANRMVFTSSDYPGRSQSATLAATTTYTFSVWIKRVSGSGSGRVQIEGVAAGVITATTTFTGTTEWQRITVTGTTTGSGAARVYIYPEYDAGRTGEYLIWGAQLEAGSFATSYIPNRDTALGVTRNADVASVGVSQFPYSASEGTLVASGSRFGTAASNNVIAELGDGGATNIFELYRVSGTSNGALYVASGGSSSTITLNNAFPVDTVSKIGGVYKANDFQAAANGTLGTPVTSGAVPTPASTLYLGRYGGSNNNHWNGWIRQITYLPRRITNAELQSRTA